MKDDPMTDMQTPLRIDIVSDVVCPWCIVGFRQLGRALDQAPEGMAADIHWHPFELNPHMPPEGQDLREHIAEKYGSTEEQSQAVRDRLTALGETLGFRFNFTPDGRIHNTFQAHQLLHWARQSGKESKLKLRLFSAFFSERKVIDDDEVLIKEAVAVGLNAEQARQVLKSGEFEQAVREEQSRWISMGVRAVPAFVFNNRQVVSGAQPESVFEEFLITP